ncbi:LysR family transcriptional regulator [Cryptosporangium aurantiacum]|uniref:DNA-binding transcriptional regulator, LysR family n=1 Tax=Cryptosporangium aurantiacum TaxID=134849 RepID=A0A1M7R488_9ACTN|nr:LysR family transcriptional regulator [Cryptosporangium aurantiacum]SHN39835.1 DNA-binding transcriptional regulator, LysR family [Cryptosporangium aurantiacum]
MQILHLRYFVVVAEELHFTRAAERLSMATSPLSRRIRDLERELDAPLFVRAHHDVTLTPAGAALLPLARDVLARFDALPDELRRSVGDTRRSAIVGVAPDVPPGIRDRYLDAVRNRAPGLPVAIHADNTAPLLRAVRAGQVDLAFVHGRVSGSDLVAVRVHTQPAGVAVGRRAGFEGRTSLRLEELAALSYVSINPDAAPSVYRGVETLLRRHGIRRRMELESTSVADLAHVVAGGKAFTFAGLTSGATHKAFAGEPVVVLPVDGARIQLTTDAVWRSDREHPGDVVADLASCVDAVAQDG